MAEKGRSTSQRTRHMNIRYFFIHDCIARHEVKVIHRGTDEMDADFFTKPLRKDVFVKFRRRIMGEE